MAKKRRHDPKDINELIEICYGSDYSRKKKYQDLIISDVMTPKREEEVLDSINPSLKVDRIKERKDVKTPDFVIESEKIFIEVTSLNLPTQIGEDYTEYFSKLDIPRKLSEVIAHIEEKDRLGKEDYSIGGVLFIDPIIASFTDIMKEERLIEYMLESTFLSSNIDYLFVRVDSASINGVNSEKFYPPVIFIKDEKMKWTVNRVFPNIKVINVFCERVKRLFSEWRPLVNTAGKKVLLWDYDKSESIPVIYRFVISKVGSEDKYTIYVGSGENLSGRGATTSLVYQYRSGNRRNTIRPKIEDEINRFKEGYEAWTEIIELDEVFRDNREILENLIIVKCWLEYVKRSNNDIEAPKFLNEKIEKLSEIVDLVKCLSFLVN